MIAIPGIAWRRPIGVPYEGTVRPRVEAPMIDDGPWGGVPLGGMGAGSIGRTHRGDFARWHLDVGVHRFEPIPACQFSLFTAGPGRPASAHVLSTLRPDALPTWGWDLPVGAGTYHARMPYAWFEIDWDELPVRVVQRQFSPLIAGNYRESSYPVGIFETAIENRSDTPLRVGLMLTWQNLIGRGAGEDRRGGHRNAAVRGDGCAGVVLAGPPDTAGAPWAGTFAIAAPEEAGTAVTLLERFDVDHGADVWADFATDGRLDPTPPGPPSRPGEAIGAALAMTVDLGPGESRVLPAALAWDLPFASFGGGTRWNRRHTRFFGTSGTTAWSIAAEGVRQRKAWSAAIDAWQAPILDDPARPEWYRAALFNELYYLVDGGTVWTDGPPVRPAGPPSDGPAAPPQSGAGAAGDGDVGRFGLLESFDYPFYNTLDVNFYASFALLRLWPRLERAVIREFVASVAVDDPAPVEIEWSGLTAKRKCPGALPHDVGAPFDDPFLRLNSYRFQNVNVWKDLNCKFVLQLWRDAVVLDDPALARDAWPEIVAALDHVAAFDRDGDGLPDHDGEPDQTYDTWPMHGPSAYGGLLWLAALRAGLEVGQAVGDPATVDRFRDRIARGGEALERRLWTGRYYRYAGEGPSADSIMADQLAGQWYADTCGLGDVVPPERVERTLRTIHECNVLGFEGGQMGAVNGIRPDGTVDASSEQSPEVWIGATYALAALMLGRGLTQEAWRTAWGAWNVTYNRGLWFRTPEAYDRDGNYRASMYLRPLAIWAIEEALARRRG
ncbi:MAG TPA: non-lysosomal glucosylceramidase [Candidatus Limnocylindrales bacterium]|nr:non-lysosomal glucosylceramidase [Candidatus Limnocylindrales bacterium]